MTTILPKDANDNPIPALRLKPSGAHAIAASGTSAKNSTAFNANTQVVSVYATVPVYLKFGSGAITAVNTDHYFPADVYYDFAIGGDGVGHFTDLAVLAVGDSGDVYVSEKE